MMNTQLHILQKKISSIQYGILRYWENDEQKSLQVKIVVNGKDLVNCKIIDHDVDIDLIDQHVNIVQKYHEDYLFASGTVKNQAERTKIVSVKLIKAVWFTKMQKGNISWLQEVQKYEHLDLRALKIA